METPPYVPSALRAGLEDALLHSPAAPTAGSVHLVISVPVLAQLVVLHAPQVVMASSPAKPAQAAQHVAQKP
jgi:hypothetical protein